MRIVKGNLFDYEGQAIGHGVNTMGLMGAGIAVAFRDKFPGLFGEYMIWCERANGGDVLLYQFDDKLIVNIASQEEPGPNATYAFLARGLFNAARHLADLDIFELAIPKIGCGIGSLDWEAVEIIIYLAEFCLATEFGGQQFEFVIYSPEGQ